MKYNQKQLKLNFPVICILTVTFFIFVVAYPAFSISLDNLQVSSSFATATNPDMVWTGSNYGLVWNDSRHGGEPEIYFIRLNGLGERIAREIKISDSSDKISNQPTIIWADNFYAVAWAEYDRNETENTKNGCQLYLKRLTKEGKKYGGIILVTADNYGSCPSNPSISWTGLTYGIAWHESRVKTETSQIFFIKLNSLGEKQSDEIQISQTPDAENPSMVWTSREYGLVWQAKGEIYFNRLDADGLKQGEDIKVSQLSATSTNPDIVWNEAGYGLVWQGYDKRDQRQIYFAQLDEEGNKQLERAITSNQDENYSIEPSIIWGNSEYGVVWQKEDGQIYFVNLDTKGHRQSKPSQISQATEGEASQAVIASGTSQYAFAWQGSRGNGQEIYFAKLPFSDIVQDNQLVAFIKNLNGNSWLIIILVLMAMILFGFIYRVKRERG